MPFDVVTADTPHSVAIPNALEPRDDASPLDLAESFNPCLAGQHDRIGELVPDPGELDTLICTMKIETADTAFQIGILAGAIFAGCSDREIDRLERGLVHATAVRWWRVKD